MKMATFSTTEALKSLDEEIKKTEDELNELNTTIAAFTNPSEVDDKLIVEQSQKERELDELRKKRIALVGMAATDSYRGKEPTGALGKINLVHLRDNRIEKVNTDLAAAHAKLAVIPTDAKSAFLKLEHTKTAATIKRLEAKKGEIEERQKKIVNKRLQRELKRITAKTKSDGTYDANKKIQSKYETLRTKNVLDASSALHNKHYFTAIDLGSQAIGHFARIKMLDLYFASFRQKKVIVDGFNKLSTRLKNWLRSKKDKINNWLIDKLDVTGRSR